MLSVECSPDFLLPQFEPALKTTSATVTIKKTALTTALSRKNATLIQFRLRRRAIQCSSTRQPTMIIQPTRYAMRNRQSRPNASSRPHITRCARNAACSAFFLSPRHDERVQAVRLVELVILQRVNDVEADEPQHDRQRERGHLQNFQYGNIRSFHRQPRADGREREREAEKNVRVIREPLRQRIKTNHHERDGRQDKNKADSESSWRQPTRAAGQAKQPGAEQGNLAGGQMAVGRARIQRVEFAVHDAVEGHRAGARADHRRENQPKRPPARPAAIVPRRHGHRRQRERQGEDRVREAHERSPFLIKENIQHLTFNAQHRSISQLRRRCNCRDWTIGAIRFGNSVWLSGCLNEKCGSVLRFHPAQTAGWFHF
jgi:hypothetical protein